MSSDYDATEFIDGDFHTQKSPFSAVSASSGHAAARRAPTREEVDSRVAEAQQKLAELKRAQEDLERERSALEVTRALTTLENARMEWNTARLKFPLLSGSAPGTGAADAPGSAPVSSVLGTRSFGELCRLGFALTWPLAGVVLLAVGVLVALLL